MAAPATLLNSSVGRKIVMAVTGIVLSLFVLGHMAGNLQAFLPNGPAALDHYGAFLRELLHGTGIWFVRAGLLLAVGLHVWAYLGLTLKSWAARPKGYSVNDFEEATFASRSMRWTGPHPRGLHRLSPHAPDGRQRAPALRRGQGLPEPRHGPRARARRAFLHPRDGLPRLPPVARSVVDAADARPLAPEVPQGAEGLRHRLHRPRHGRLRPRAARGPRGHAEVGTDMELKSNIPDGPLEKKWDKYRFDMKLVNPANKRKYSVIVVGSGLAGGAGAASLAELGYNVSCFCYQDSPRRAHSIAAQGGINASKNYQNDGDSIQRLFYDTIK